MAFPIHIDKISIGLPILYFNGVSLSHKVVFILANSVDPDEMQYHAAIHLGLHCLSEYKFMVFLLIRACTCMPDSLNVFIVVNPLKMLRDSSNA